MTERPRPPDDLPVGNGHPGTAAAASPPADDHRDALAAVANRRAAILKRFRDYMHDGRP
jgi:hypothetical protein